MKKIKIKLILERGKREIWGRVDFEGDLIIVSGGTEDALKLSIYGQLLFFHGLDSSQIEFETSWEN